MPSMLFAVLRYLAYGVEWLFRKFAIKSIILKSQIATSILVLTAVFSFYIGILWFLIDMLAKLKTFLFSIGNISSASGLFWQALATSGVTQAVVDAYAIYYPGLILLATHVLSSAAYKTSKLVSDELFKIGVLSMQ